MSLLTSILTGGTNSHQTTSELANALATDLLNAGVVDSVANTGGVAPCSGGFAPNAQGSPNMTIAISAGVEYILVTPTGQGTQMLRVKNTASSNVTIAANATGSTKYDWIYVKVDPDVAINTDAGGDDAALFFVCRSTSNTVDNSGTTPAFANLIAVVTVANGASSISNGTIADKRTQFGIRAQSSQADGWHLISSQLAYSANQGNRVAVLTATTDLTGLIGPGTKLKIPRGTTPPTQCTALNGTTQYWNKTSGITGMSFTDDFVNGAWVKLTSYPVGDAYISSRYNGTSGWGFGIDSSGRVLQRGYNASSSNFSDVKSLQSIPLNRWVHIAAQLDMSAFTASPTTSYVMIDGVDVPAVVSHSGTNPTALIQAGSLEIGSIDGGVNNFPGEIAETVIFSAKVTQATLQSYMAQSMIGSETSVISYYKFNGNGNDSNSNANNLTPNGSALATTVDNPFNTNEYAIVLSASYSAPTTTLTVFSGQNSIIPNQTLSPSSYSRDLVPLNFPAFSSFKLNAFDTSGTLTNPLLVLLAKYANTNSMDGILYVNVGTAGGTIYLSVNGTNKKLSGNTNGATTGGTTYAITFPTSFLSSVQSATLDVAGSSGSTTGAYLVTGQVTASGANFYSGTNPKDAYFTVSGN